jgi:NTE family protein
MDARKALWVVISGGAAKGAYAVGALKYMIMELEWKIAGLAGTSVGGLIAGHQVMWSNDHKKTGYTALEDLFLSVRTQDIWENWFLLGKVAGLWKQGLADSSPLNGLIKKMLDGNLARDSDRKMRVTAVNLNTKELQVFDESFVPLWQPVAATATMPMFWPPIRMRNHLWVDGGVRVQTPIKCAIDAGATKIVAITLTPKGHIGEFDPDSNSIDIGLRSIDAMLDELVERDIKIANLYNEVLSCKKVEGKRPVEIIHIRPDSPLLEDPTQFNPKEAAEIHLRGFGDAERVLAQERWEQ